MYSNPRLASYVTALDDSAALAFGLTSYLSALSGIQLHEFRACVGNDLTSKLSRFPCVAPEREVPMKAIHCERANEPRDSLDRLIMAWQAGNHVSLEATLGPRAKVALDQMLKSRSWRSIRAELWSGAPGRGAAMGYRFNVPGRWSEPRETLEEERERTILVGNPDSVEIETSFYNRSGSGCGKLRLAFVMVTETGWRDLSSGGSVPGPPQYLIDNSDLADLLRLTAACAADNSRAN